MKLNVVRSVLTCSVLALGFFACKPGQTSDQAADASEAYSELSTADDGSGFFLADDANPPCPNPNSGGNSEKVEVY